MPKTKQQYSEIKEERRMQIVNAGLKVFCEKGYDYSTIDDIVKKSGCSHGLFYHYFKSKKEIFDEVLKLNREHSLTKTNYEIDNIPTYREKLRIIINRLFDDLKSNENATYYFYFFVSQCFSKKENGVPSKKKKLPNNEKPPQVILESFFSEGQKKGEITKKYSARACTELFMSIITGATLSYTIAPKDAIKHIKLPNIDFILDIFCIGDSNEKTRK